MERGGEKGASFHPSPPSCVVLGREQCLRSIKSRQVLLMYAWKALLSGLCLLSLESSDAYIFFFLLVNFIKLQKAVQPNLMCKKRKKHGLVSASVKQQFKKYN